MEVTENILSKIQLTNHMKTYTNDDYLFHYICADRIIYMCISDAEFPRQRAFAFLSDIKTKFLSLYGLTAATALPYAMNTEFPGVMATQMNRCNDNSPYDNIDRVQAQVDELKDIMVENIEKVMERGEHLNLLVERSETLLDIVSILMLQ